METSMLDHVAKAAAMPGITPIVYVVDDDISVREGLAGLIRSEGWKPLVFGSAQEFLRQEPARQANCAVLDVSMPGVSGLDLQEQVSMARPDMPIIFITGFGDVPTSVRAMKAGAVEFLTKPVSDEVLLAAIRGALERSAAARVVARETRMILDRYELLSSREKEVMAWVVTGLMNKQVASKMGISEVTVKAHRGQVMRKMEVESLAELVTIASRISAAK